MDILPLMIRMKARFDEEAWIRQTSLDNICRQQQVNDGEFGTLSDVPETALTLTIPALMSCKKVICIVPTGAESTGCSSDTLWSGFSCLSGFCVTYPF